MIIVLTKNIEIEARDLLKNDDLCCIVQRGRATIFDLCSQSSLFDTIVFEPHQLRYGKILDLIHGEDEPISGCLSVVHLNTF